MICSICELPIQVDENYTVLVCCQTHFHAGCIHRRYVSRDKSCPKCKNQSPFPYDQPNFQCPTQINYKSPSTQTLKNWLGPLVYKNPNSEKK